MKAAEKSGFQAAAVTAACVPATLLLQFVKFSAAAPPAVQLLVNLAAYAVISAPVIAFCIIKKIRPSALGLSGISLLKSLLPGVFPAAVIVSAGPHLLRPFFRTEGGKSAGVGDAAVFAAAAFFEEVIFRGFLQKRLCESMGKMRGLFLSSAVFVVFHLPKLVLSGAPAASAALTCAAVFCGALIFGGLALVFDNIWPSVFVHAAANFVLSSI